MTPENFLKTYGDAIIKACINTNIFPSVKAAQMAVESAWGAAIIANNGFGIKAAGAPGKYWNGDRINAATKEVYNGQTVGINADFRAYKSVSDSIKDHTQFLQSNTRYTSAGVFSATTPEEQARALQAAGYATDPNYSDKLIQIINKYGFKALDAKKKRLKYYRILAFTGLALIAVYSLYKIWK